MQLADRLDRISEPQTILMAKKGRELKAKGINIIDLSLGEPDFKTPEHIVAAAVKAMDEGYTKYTPVAGFPELREAICIKLKRDNQLDYLPENILVSTGAKQSLANVILSLINPGDEVIIPAPYWVTYRSLVDLAQGQAVVVSCPVDQQFKITPRQLEDAITPQTKMFIFSSPCNPSGAVYSRSELEELVQVFEKHPQIILVSDEIYEYINYTSRHESIAAFESLKDRVVVVNGFSKGFAMTGWRLGYMAGPPSLVKACEKLQAQITSGSNSIAQRAAITALLSDLGPTEAMTAAFDERKAFFVSALAGIPGMKINPPEGAFYAFPDISAWFGKRYQQWIIQNADDLALYLLNEGHVTGVSGAAFGAPDCIRFSFATSMDQLKIAVERLEVALGQLR